MHALKFLEKGYGFRRESYMKRFRVKNIVILILQK